MANRMLLGRLRPILVHRGVSTSKKNNDTVTAEVCEPQTQPKKPVNEKNWISYGYNPFNKEADRYTMHSLMFTGVTLCLVVTGFIWGYYPDYNLRDWATREAFLEMRRREASGAPLIDPNFIDPLKIQLPTDDELGNMEIII